jgi:glycosyltransferase involved in cell wall biosynthesis
MLLAAPTSPEPVLRPTAPADLLLPGLSVVLPCFDEEQNVARAIAEALAAGAACAAAVEVVVVDDGSADRTPDVAFAAARLDRRVRVVEHPHNRGYGAAVRSGIRASRMPWVLLTDADLQFDLQEVRSMLEPAAAGADLVAGYRLDRSDPLGRRLAAAAWNRLVRRTFGVGVRDVDCAFKLVRGDALRRLPLASEGAMVSTELVRRGTDAGWRVAEVGVTHRPRVAGTPTGGDPRVVLRAFAERAALRRALAAEAGAATTPAAGRVALP